MTKAKNSRNRFKKALLLAGLIELYIFLSKKGNRKMIKKEYKTVKKSYNKNISWFRDYFVPNELNGHKPKILHSKSVRALTLGLLVTKIALVSALLIFFPTGGRVTPAIENEMVSLTNEYRQSLGAQPLVRNEYLNNVAMERAQDMFSRNYFSHYSPEGLKPWEWLDPNKYQFIRFGENLAIDFVTANGVFKAFQASPSHDKNLKNANYSEVGIAMLTGTMEGRETNLMVVLYGEPKVIPQPVQVAQVDTSKDQPQPIEQPIVKPVTPTQPVVEPPKPVPVPSDADRLKPPPAGNVIVDGKLAVKSSESPAVQGLEDTYLQQNEQTVVVVPSTNWLQRVVAWSDNLYLLIILAFILIALVNIFVAIKVQHRSTIIASLFMIAFASLLWWSNWHQLEGLPGVITILSSAI